MFNKYNVRTSRICVFFTVNIGLLVNPIHIVSGFESEVRSFWSIGDHSTNITAYHYIILASHNNITLKYTLRT